MQNSIPEALMVALKARFAKYPDRHPGLDWNAVQARLEKSPHKLQVLAEMEASGGEPDVIAYDDKSGEYIFCDCSAETPPERRSLCYDRAALDSRKENKPRGSVVETAAAMGVELLDEQQYRQLQALGEFDRKTSSWVLTPEPIRSLGGALFCDRRYGQVFVYHNGAESYYSSRGFRGRLAV